MKRLHFIAVLIPCWALLTGAEQPVAQISASERSRDSSPLQIDSNDAKTAPPAAVDQASGKGKPVPAADQVSDGPRQAEPVDQLGGREKAAPATRQLSAPEKTAEAPEPLTTRAEGRKTAVVPVAGHDRCDKPADTATPDELCANVIETRGEEFTRPDPLVLSPEQRLLSQQPTSHATRSIDAATRRLANEGEPIGMTEQGVAATAYPNPINKADSAIGPPQGQPLDLPAIADIIARIPAGK